MEAVFVLPEVLMEIAKNQPSKRTLAKDSKRFARGQATHMTLGHTSFPSDVPSGWPASFSELADAILDPRVTVTNRDRDTLAKGIPFGCMTNKHGESIRPQFRALSETV